MIMDDFEKKLCQQPLRPIPAEWRSRILARAAETSRPRPAEFDSRQSWISRLLWPYPRAWGALAVIWTVLLTIHISLSEGSNSQVRQDTSPSPQVAQVLKEQRRLMAELIGQSSIPDAEPAKPTLVRPQSRRTQQQLIA
jgi:hypothetical protein